MKHLRNLTETIPAKAITDDHPDIFDSINGLFAAPVPIIAFHIRVLLNKQQSRIEF